jgi:hypothetical protein
MAARVRQRVSATGACVTWGRERKAGRLPTDYSTALSASCGNSTSV